MEMISAISHLNHRKLFSFICLPCFCLFSLVNDCKHSRRQGNSCTVSQVDKDGNGSISLSEYFGIFEEHGIVVNKTETNRWLSKMKK